MSAFRFLAACPAACLLALASPTATAHVSLLEKQATVDARYEAGLRVGHGCKGSPTIKLRVRIPEGVLDVAVPPHPGWTIDVLEADYAQAQTADGRSFTRGVQEITWHGGRAADGDKPVFTFSAYLSPALQAGTTLFFPVIQECEQGLTRWIDTAPQRGKSQDDHSESPAPALKLLPKAQP